MADFRPAAIARARVLVQDGQRIAAGSTVVMVFLHGLR